MSSGTTKIGALFFNSCDTLGGGVTPIVGLTDDYNTFVSAINNSYPQGGDGMVAYSMVKAYDFLTGVGSNPNAEKNIIIITNKTDRDWETNVL